MKIKYIISIAVAILLFICSILFYNFSNQNDKVEDETLPPISNLNEYEDITIMLNNTTKNDGITFELPKENSVQDYNTYYGNQILKLFEAGDSKLVESYVYNFVNKKDFIIYKDGDIFESIERIYHMQKLANDYSPNFHSDEIFMYTKQFIEEKYDSSGFFYYEEFDDYMVDMTQSEIETTRLYHTMMTLYLCHQYKIVHELDKNAIENYILNLISNDGNAINLYYSYLCFKYLGSDTSFYNNMPLSYDTTAMDLIEIHSFVSLSNELNKAFDNDNIRQLMNAYVSECRISNLMELFYALDILDKIEEPIEALEKQRILSLLKIYRNEDGTFPNISAYILDNKQLLMHYSLMERMNFQPDIKDYQPLLLNDFTNQDGYDLYAYSYFATRLNLDTTELKRKLVEELRNCSLTEKSYVGYLLLAFNELDFDIKKYNEKNNCIDKEIINYISLITSSEAIEYNTSDLILLYGFLKTDIIEYTDTMLNCVQSLNIDKSQDMQAITLYYQYQILKQFEERTNKNVVYDKNQLHNSLLNLRCYGGFKMNPQDNFLDLQATYYLTNLIE